jgi:uncharacterized membrane protein
VVAAVEEWAPFFHLLGAFLFVAGVTVAGVAFEAARLRRRPREVAFLLGLARIGVLLVAFGALILLPFGLWLVHIDGFGYGAGWVDAALALFVVLSILGAVGGQRPKRARNLAARLAQEEDAESSELRALLDDRIALTLNYLSAAPVIAIIVLTVFKPGTRGG